MTKENVVKYKMKHPSDTSLVRIWTLMSVWSASTCSTSFTMDVFFPLFRTNCVLFDILNESVFQICVQGS